MNRDKLTPPLWRWVWQGNAGYWSLTGDNGNGPITHSGPDSADGRAKAAAPELLAVCEALIAYRDSAGPLNFQLEKADDYINRLRVIIAKVGSGDSE